MASALVSFSNLYHVGVRKVVADRGFVYSDFSVGYGVFGSSTSGNSISIPDGDYMSSDACVTADWAFLHWAASSPACPQARGICKKPIGESRFKELWIPEFL